jgi:hypothetical protein
VDQGQHPSAKSKPSFCNRRHFHARAGFGPGVFISGATPRRTPSARRALCATAVRHGNRPVAVPL